MVHTFTLEPSLLNEYTSPKTYDEGKLINVQVMDKMEPCVKDNLRRSKLISITFDYRGVEEFLYRWLGNAAIYREPVKWWKNVWWFNPRFGNEVSVTQSDRPAKCTTIGWRVELRSNISLKWMFREPYTVSSEWFAPKAVLILWAECGAQQPQNAMWDLRPLWSS